MIQAEEDKGYNTVLVYKIVTQSRELVTLEHPPPRGRYSLTKSSLSHRLQGSRSPTII